MITRNVRIINYHFEYSLYRISEACHRGILTICIVDHPGPGYHFCPQILVTKGARWNTVSTNNLWQWGPWIGVDLHHVWHLCIASLPFRQQWKVISPPTRFPDKLQQLCHVIGTVMLQLYYYKQLQLETCTRCIPMKSYDHTWILECMGMYSTYFLIGVEIPRRGITIVFWNWLL